jgi:uncharacterized protein (TIGR03067 family)
MRRTILLAGVLLSVVALGSDSPKGYDDKTEVAGIEGTWRLTELEFHGRKIDLPVQRVTTLRGETYTVNVSKGEILRGSFHIDPAHKPPHLDWMPTSGTFKGHTVKCIYQIDGDTLRIASNPGVDDKKQYPQGFNDNGAVVETYKRVK